MLQLIPHINVRLITVHSPKEFPVVHSAAVTPHIFSSFWGSLAEATGPVASSFVSAIHIPLHSQNLSPIAAACPEALHVP